MLTQEPLDRYLDSLEEQDMQEVKEMITERFTENSHSRHDYEGFSNNEYTQFIKRIDG